MHPRHLFPALCVAAAVASCGPIDRDVNLAGLEPGRRSLDLRNDIKIVKLTNGLTVAMIADDRTNLVSVDVRYKVGASQDPAGRAGLAHLLEHLTFQTAADSQGGTIFDKLQAIALEFNAYTTTTSRTTPRPRWPTASTRSWRWRRAGSRRRAPRSRRRRSTASATSCWRRRRSGPPRGRRCSRDRSRRCGDRSHPYARAIGSREVATATQGRGLRVLRQLLHPRQRDPGGGR
jgi:zinc protease